jgi:hypothetical protein
LEVVERPKKQRFDGPMPAKKETLIVLYKKCRVRDGHKEEPYALGIEPAAADHSNNEIKDQSAPLNDASKIEM